MGELDGKVAIVTGVGRQRGLGRAAAQSLARLGCDVVVTGTGRDPSTFPPEEREAGWKGVESVAALVRAEGRRALPMAMDVTSAQEVERMTERTVDELGRIDILINNAAYPRGPDRVPLVDLPEDIFRKVLEVKVTGTFLCCRAAIPIMVGQGDGGKIVNLSSILGKQPQANTAAYAAANSAIHALTAGLAAEVAHHQINVNCVCPGPLDTARNDILGREVLDSTAAQIPLGRLGTPEEVADFMAYLCTQAAVWIHGQSININGGQVTAP